MSLTSKPLWLCAFPRVKTDYFISALSIMAFITSFLAQLFIFLFFKKKKKPSFLALLNVLKEK